MVETREYKQSLMIQIVISYCLIFPKFPCPFLATSFGFVVFFFAPPLSPFLPNSKNFQYFTNKNKMLMSVVPDVPPSTCPVVYYSPSSHHFCSCRPVPWEQQQEVEHAHPYCVASPQFTLVAALKRLLSLGNAQTWFTLHVWQPT